MAAREYHLHYPQTGRTLFTALIRMIRRLPIYLAVPSDGSNPMQLEATNLEVSVIFTCSTLRRVEPYATCAVFRLYDQLHRLAVPSDGSNPMQHHRCLENTLSGRDLQYPQTGRTLCNIKALRSIPAN